MASRWKWLMIPLSLGLGTAAGVVIDRQILSRSAEARAREALAVAEAVKRPSPDRVPEPLDAPEPTPVRRLPQGRNPFDLEPADGEPGQPALPPFAMSEESPPKVEPPLVLRNGQPELDPPPGYFDLPAPHKGNGTDPPLVKRGQIIQVEVLEALPGRPITGDRLVRPDGTISLGFYGDLQVAGLNRYQIKARLFGHLREYINDDVLGLIGERPDGTSFAIPPVESSRIFIDETRVMEANGQVEAIPEAKIGGGRAGFRAEIREGRLDIVEKEIQQFVKNLNAIRDQIATAKPADPKNPQPAASDEQEENEFNESVIESTIQFIELNFKRTIKEFEAIRAEALEEKAAGATRPPLKRPRPGSRAVVNART